MNLLKHSAAALTLAFAGAAAAGPVVIGFGQVDLDGIGGNDSIKVDTIDSVTNLGLSYFFKSFTINEQSLASHGAAVASFGSGVNFGGQTFNMPTTSDTNFADLDILQFAACTGMGTVSYAGTNCDASASGLFSGLNFEQTAWSLHDTTPTNQWASDFTNGSQFENVGGEAGVVGVATQAFQVSNVPEPGTFGLVAAAGLAAGALRRRKDNAPKLAA